MFMIAFALAVLPVDGEVTLLTSHQHEKVFIWIKNHIDAPVESLTVRITATKYDKEHVVWGKDQLPIPPGKAKRAYLVIAEFDRLKLKDIDASITELNGVKVAPKPKAKPKAPPKPPRLSVYVDKVMDGDTLEVHDENGNRYTVRLQGIDSPESSQAFGLDARNLLSKLTIGKTLELEVHEKDRYSRTLGFVYGVGGVNINLAMLQKGMAWHYVKYSKSAEFARAEATAKKARVGIWSAEKRIAPWDYRNGVRVETEKVVNAASTRTTDTTVYITKSGAKYHRTGCRYLSKSKIPIPLSRAKSAYDPCTKCHPPH